MKTLQIFLTVFLFSLISIGCQKNNESYTEKRIIGQWEFEKISHKENFSIQKEDLISEYENSTLEFLENGTANFNHQNNNYSGTWEVIINNFQNVVSENLTVVLSENSTNEVIHFNFNNISVNRNTFWADKQNHDSWYRYKLKRK